MSILVSYIKMNMAAISSALAAILPTLYYIFFYLFFQNNKKHKFISTTPNVNNMLTF